MAHANKTYINNSGSVGVNSLFPAGDVTTPSSGITVTGTKTHGNTITITASSGVSFGSVGPDFLVMYKMENMTAGTDLTLVEGTTHKTGYVGSSAKLYYTAAGLYKMAIHSVAALPYGVGMAVGDYQAHNRDSTPIIPKMRIDAIRPSAKIFNSLYMIWPAANQVNQLADHSAGEQVKLIGDQFDNGFSLPNGSKVDVYIGPYSTDQANANTMEPRGVMSKNNSAAFHEADSWPWPASGNGVLGHQLTTSTTTQKSNVQIYQSFFISKNPTNTCHSRVIDTALGEVCNYTDTHPTPSSCLFPNFNNFEFPKNAQGMNVSQGKNYYVGTLYHAYGEGAACRVEIADVATPVFQSTGNLDPNQKKLSVCIPLYWSDKLLKVELVEGLFAGASLTGKYLHVYGINNNFIASCQL